MSKPTDAELELMRLRKDAAHSALKFFTKKILGVTVNKGIKEIKSANNVFDGLNKKQKNTFYANRDFYQKPVTHRSWELETDDEGEEVLVEQKPESYVVYNDSLLGSVSHTMRTGMGNCDEKGKICYASLKCNPLLLKTGKRGRRLSYVTLVASNNPVIVTKEKKTRDSSGKKVIEIVEKEKERGYDHVFVVVSDDPIGDSWTSIKNLGLTAMIVDGWTQDWYFPNLSAFWAKWYNLGNTPNPRQAVVRHNVQSHNTKRYSGLEDLEDLPEVPVYTKGT